MNKIQIFGYGSLINEESMRDSSPNATDFKPAIIKGFNRSFSKWDEVGFISKQNQAVSGIGYGALDVQPTKSGEVNGVVFKVDELEFQKQIEREYGYKHIETTAYDFEDGTNLGTTYVFSAEEPEDCYEAGNPAQEWYLNTCLLGAETFGDKFYNQFLETSYVNGTKLVEMLKSSDTKNNH